MLGRTLGPAHLVRRGALAVLAASFALAAASATLSIAEPFEVHSEYEAYREWRDAGDPDAAPPARGPTAFDDARALVNEIQIPVTFVALAGLLVSGVAGARSKEGRFALAALAAFVLSPLLSRLVRGFVEASPVDMGPDEVRAVGLAGAVALAVWPAASRVPRLAAAAAAVASALSFTAARLAGAWWAGRPAEYVEAHGLALTWSRVVPTALAAAALALLVAALAAAAAEGLRERRDAAPADAVPST